MTDEATYYTSTGREFRGHGTVNHSIEQYVRGGFWHTNTVENYFSILKRGIYGVYRHESARSTSSATSASSTSATTPVASSEETEIHRVEIFRLRVELVIGSLPDAVSESLGHDDESVQISLLVDSLANPPLLSVEFAALSRARDMIAEQ